MRTTFAMVFVTCCIALLAIPHWAIGDPTVAPTSAPSVSASRRPRVSASSAAASAAGEDWPSWRGPRGDGTSLETGVPIRWDDKQNVLWKTPIPGGGHSSPIAWGDRVWVTSADERAQARLLLCLDRADGKVLWQREVLRSAPEHRNNLNSCASSTPATDGRYVWATFLQAADNTVQVVCYDMDGKEVWRKSPGRLLSVHGYCSSMLPYKDTIILNADQDAEAYIVALDKATGAERWRIDRPNRMRSYVPPVVFDLAGKKQLVLSGSKCVASYDPDTGKQFWIVDGPTDQFVASLVQADGVLMLTGGYPTLHILGIRPDGEGNVTKTHVLWHQKKDPSYVPSPIAFDKWLFVVADNGVTNCMEAKTGKYLWRQQLGRHHSSSPVLAEGRIYFLDDDGTTHVVKAGPEFELLAANKLAEPCRSSPAISRGCIYIRAEHNLYCIK